MHTNTINTYKEANLLSLSDQRKLSVAKYVTRCLSVSNSVTNEIFIDSVNDYPKRAQQISSLRPIRNYVSDLFDGCNVDMSSIPLMPMVPKIPQWEHKQANFNVDYTTQKKDDLKSENILILIIHII